MGLLTVIRQPAAFAAHMRATISKHVSSGADTNAQFRELAGNADCCPDRSIGNDRAILPKFVPSSPPRSCRSRLRHLMQIFRGQVRLPCLARSLPDRPAVASSSSLACRVAGSAVRYP